MPPSNVGGAWVGPNYVMTTIAMVLALLQHPGAVSTLAVGDRRGVFRDASNAGGWPALACDRQPCESTQQGYFYRGDGDALAAVPRVQRLITFAPCEQQTLSLGL